MKKLILTAVLVTVALGASGQGLSGILNRYTDPEKGHVTFIEKGNHAFGISGTFRSFVASGNADGDGYSVFSLLNIGNGKAQIWSVSPSFSTFIADDLSIGVSVHYSGYLLDTDLRLDFRDVIGSDEEDLNWQFSHRHMLRHAGGVSFNGRKYMSFFGSRTVGVFGEARLYSNYGVVASRPIPKDGSESVKIRHTRAFDIGFKACGGLAVRLRDGSAITLSVPIFGVAYQTSRQTKQWGVANDEEGQVIVGAGGKLDRFTIARDVEQLGIQFGYVRYIAPKKH